MDTNLPIEYKIGYIPVLNRVKYGYKPSNRIQDLYIIPVLNRVKYGYKPLIEYKIGYHTCNK